MLNIMGVLLGAIVGGFVSYLVSIKITDRQAGYAAALARIQARRIAGAKLRAAFAPEIAEITFLKEKEISKAYDILKNAFTKHAAAIEEYRCFVPPDRTGAYQEAWEHYYSPPEAQGDVFFAFQDYSEGIDRKELFENRVKAIFRFTEF